MLRELLNEYEYLVKALSPQSWIGARPGLPETEIIAKVESAGLGVPRELLTWWSWCDGRDRSGGFASMIAPQPLDVVLRHRVEVAPYGTEVDQWPDEWLWVGREQNDAMAVRCLPVEDPPLVRLLSPWVYGLQPDGDVSHQVVSLCTPVAMFLNSVEAGWLQVVDGQWNADRFDERPMSYKLSQLG